MSRARNIKPGFFENEILVSLPFETRLLFIGIWTLADREGRLEDRPTRIKMKLFPADNVDVDACLASLDQKGFIARYEVKGQRLVQILAWSKHQNPHPREAASALPAMGATVGEQPRKNQGNAKDMSSNAGSSDSLHSDSLHSDSLQELSNPTGLEVIASADDLPAQGLEEPTNGVSHADRTPIQAIVAMYHAKLPNCRKCEKITPARAGYIRQRWREDLPTIEAWGNFFDYAAQSAFLMGRTPGRDGKPPFVADLEFLTKPSSFVKIAEGKYHQ